MKSEKLTTSFVKCSVKNINTSLIANPPFKFLGRPALLIQAGLGGGGNSAPLKLLDMEPEFTGFLDANGHKIYVGDIIQHINGNWVSTVTRKIDNKRTGDNLKGDFVVRAEEDLGGFTLTFERAANCEIVNSANA